MTEKHLKFRVKPNLFNIQEILTIGDFTKPKEIHNTRQLLTKGKSSRLLLQSALVIRMLVIRTLYKNSGYMNKNPCKKLSSADLGLRMLLTAGIKSVI
jgi:hypothetical protein